MIAELVAVAAGSYLIGSIPSGFLLARLRHVDVRRTGSGNIGATNVARSAGALLGLLTLAIDVLKGALPVALVGALGWDVGGTPAMEQHARITAALAAVAGHVFPFALGFRGGKGVATAMGALLVLAPAALPVPLALFALALLALRRVSLASIAAAVATPAAAAWSGYDEEVTTAIGALSALIVLRHRANIGRLIAGTEPRIGQTAERGRD